MCNFAPCIEPKTNGTVQLFQLNILVGWLCKNLVQKHRIVRYDANQKMIVVLLYNHLLGHESAWKARDMVPAFASRDLVVLNIPKKHNTTENTLSSFAIVHEFLLMYPSMTFNKLTCMLYQNSHIIETVLI